MLTLWCVIQTIALDTSPVPTKIPLGQSLTEGRGAGSIPDVGKNAAIENLEDINEILAKNKMIFAGMGRNWNSCSASDCSKS